MFELIKFMLYCYIHLEIKLQSESETFMPGEIVIKIMAYFMGHIICWEVFYCIISKLKEKPVTEIPIEFIISHNTEQKKYPSPPHANSYKSMLQELLYCRKKNNKKFMELFLRN